MYRESWGQDRRGTNTMMQAYLILLIPHLVNIIVEFVVKIKVNRGIKKTAVCDIERL